MSDQQEDSSGNIINNYEETPDTIINTINSENTQENLSNAAPIHYNGRQLGRAARRVMYDDQMLDFLSFLHNSGTGDNIRPLTTQAGNNAELANSLENMILVPLASQGLLQMLGGTGSGSHSAMSEALAASFNMKPRYKKVLSDEGEGLLEKVLYDPSVHQNDRCPILHIDFEEGDEVTQLPCKHCFESDAIKRWLKDEKAECPVCRLELKSKEVKIGKDLDDFSDDEADDGEPPVHSSTSDDDEVSQLPRPPAPTPLRMSAGRLRLIESLARSMQPMQHPFGPRNGPQMMAHIVNDQDDDDDLQRAIMASLADYNSGDV